MSKDDERWRNFMIYKIWATDEEMNEIMPVIGLIVIIIGIGFGVYWLLHKLGVV